MFLWLLVSSRCIFLGGRERKGRSISERFALHFVLGSFGMNVSALMAWLLIKTQDTTFCFI